MNKREKQLRVNRAANGYKHLLIAAEWYRAAGCKSAAQDVDSYASEAQMRANDDLRKMNINVDTDAEQVSDPVEVT